MKEKKTLDLPKIQASEGEIIELPAQFSELSPECKAIFVKWEKQESTKPIYLPHPKAAFEKVFGYYERYKGYLKTTEEIRSSVLGEWEIRFFPMDIEKVMDILVLCQELNLEMMLETSCRIVACWMKGKPLQEIRNALGLEYDFDPEKEKERIINKEFALRRFNVE